MSAIDARCPPVLSCAAAAELERALFAGDEVREWAAMQSAGSAIARAVDADFLELGGIADDARLLVLVGKGHNGGDALIAARVLLERYPLATADIIYVFGSRSLRPLAARARQDLVHRLEARVVERTAGGSGGGVAGEFDLCLDGVFGFQFRAPASPEVLQLLENVNGMPIAFRAAVDLPSAGAFQADFTYATGSVKAPVLTDPRAGRVRYLDLGFFDGPTQVSVGSDVVLTSRLLEPLKTVRPAVSDKRTFGHVFLMGGSRGYPGAILMSAMAAVRSGAGLVTVFVPESLVPAYAARLPEAMWVGWPETPDGGLALEGQHLLQTRLGRASAMVIGPGLGRDRETLALVADVVRTSRVPLVLDADALQRDIVAAAARPCVLTPHAGEYQRIAGDTAPSAFSRDGITTVLKGPVTRVAGDGIVRHSLCGGPVLARGGSGDLLAGMIGTQLAQTPADPAGAAGRAVVWHDLAADLLARTHGQVAVATTQLLDFLGDALREASRRTF